MLLGRAQNGDLVLATPRAVANCPGCDARLRPKCGAAKKQIWHWAHVTKECDAWHEGEGEWHLAWKSRAPRECTEVILGPHRADIRTREGIVIELQASPIDAIEIGERESFYGKMIWLLDGRGWRAAGRFRFARGRFRRCDACTTELPNGMQRTRSGCTKCRSGRLLDRALGDRYVWDHRRRSFDEARLPVYVDTGENVVMLDGQPSRFGNARVLSYADFCSAHGLAWDPARDGAGVPVDEEDYLPDFSLLPERISRPQRHVDCSADAKAAEPLSGVRAQISIEGSPLSDAVVSREADSTEAIASLLRDEIEAVRCANHDARARVEVAIWRNRPGWAIHDACCIEFSQRVVASLKAAKKQLRVIARKSRDVG